MERIKNKFVCFLEINGVKDLFINNYINYRLDDQININSYLKIRANDEDAIGYSFRWSLTPENISFWSDMSTLWRIYMHKTKHRT